MSGAGIYIKTPSGLVAAATVPGPSGSQGPQSSLAPGTVTTGAAGTSVIVGITGAGPVQSLNLTIPKGDPGGWVASSTLADATDLNTLTTPGLYRRASLGATTALNFPFADWLGHVEVIGSSTRIIQRATYQGVVSANLENMAVFRTFLNPTWSPWQALHIKGAIGGGDLTGTGSPEGVVTAPVGVYYTDTAITNGAMRWAKKSGTGNTGWVCVGGDTGWRNVSAMLINGWSGGVYLRRVGALVEMRINGLNSASSTAATALNAILGFTPIGPVGARASLHTTASLLRRAYFDSSGLVISNYTVGDVLYGSLTYYENAWPTTLPGVAA